ncbi:MAG: type II toxin-antitoxin system HicA family toxin [Minisyncoccia bacterium]
MHKVFSSKEIVAVLLREGFIFISQKGSHAKFRKRGSGGAVTTIVPMGKDEIPPGTLRSIIRQSNLPWEIFLA